VLLVSTDPEHFIGDCLDTRSAPSPKSRCRPSTSKRSRWAFEMSVRDGM